MQSKNGWAHGPERGTWYLFFTKPQSFLNSISYSSHIFCSLNFVLCSELFLGQDLFPDLVYFSRDTSFNSAPRQCKICIFLALGVYCSLSKFIANFSHSVVPFSLAILRPRPLFKKHYWCSLWLSGMISVNWNLNKIFLFCAQFGCSLIGRIRCGWKVTIIPPWVGLCSQARLRTLSYPGSRREMHTNTHTRGRKAIAYCTGQRLRSGNITEHIVCFGSSQYIVIFLLYLCFYLSLTLLPRFLTFYLSLDKEERSLPRLQTAYAALSGL